MSTLYTDIDDFACAILEARIADGSLPPGDVVRADIAAIVSGKRMRAWIRRYSHVHLFCGIGGSPLGLAWAGWPAEWSIVTGGFPCQDISSAGKGEGLDGARSGLYREMLRAARLIRPLGIFGENVGALSARGLDRLADEMGEMGYRPHALRLGAWAVGSPQERERWWILANADRQRLNPKHDHAEDRHQGSAQEDVRAGGGQGRRLADALRHRREIENAHPGEREGRATPSGPGQSSELADVRGGGQGTERLDPARAVADVAGQSVDPGRWPHPLGVDDAGNPVPTPQYDWEPPRLFPGTNTINAQWRLALMGYPLHWLDLPAKVAARFGTDRARNKRGIEATGNAQVPQCVKLIAAAWINAMRRENVA